MRCRLPILLALSLVLAGCTSMKGWWPLAQQEEASPGEKAAKKPIEGKPEVLWRVDVDQRRPKAPAGFSLPCVVDDQGRQIIVIGGMDARLRFLDRDGSELGWLALEGGVETGALQLDNGLLVLGDMEGWLYGIDVHERQVAWRQQLASLVQGRPVPTPQGFLVQTVDNRIYHFDREGRKLWSFSGVPGGLAMRAGSTPVVAGDRVFAVMNSGDAVALRLQTGDLLWKRQLVLDTSAAVLSEIRVPMADPLLISAPGSFQDEYLLVVPIYQGRLLFLSPADGSEIRARNLSLKYRPLVKDRTLYACDTHGALYALDPATAQSIWRRQVTDGELVGPVASGGFLWAADERGHVFRFDAFGEPRGEIELPGRIDRAPVPFACGVLVRTSRGVLHFLR